jgi:mannose-6-phosphate isomerase
MIVQKPWGREIIWAHTEKYVGKILEIDAGHSLSRQFHRVKDETIYVLSGEVDLEVGPPDDLKMTRMGPGSSIRLAPMTIHRMVAVTHVRILEASTPELDDVVRIEDRYGRA